MARSDHPRPDRLPAVPDWPLWVSGVLAIAATAWWSLDTRVPTFGVMTAAVVLVAAAFAWHEWRAEKLGHEDPDPYRGPDDFDTGVWIPPPFD